MKSSAKSLPELLHFDSSLGPVSYRRIGAGGARRVIFFHGFPGSSSQLGMFDRCAPELGLDVVCFDRPGYNRSRIRTSRMLADTVALTAELADSLGWTDFEVATVSGGTPYGLHVALAYPGRVREVRVICGLGDISHPELRPLFPRQSYLGLKFLPLISDGLILAAFKMALVAQNPKKRPPLMRYFFPTSTADDACVTSTGAAATLQLNLREALVQKGLGPKQDAAVFVSDWGRDLACLQVPVQFWHGDDDVIVPDAVSAALARRIPRARYFLMPGEGHLSLPILRAGDIMRAPPLERG